MNRGLLPLLFGAGVLLFAASSNASESSPSNIVDPWEELPTERKKRKAAERKKRKAAERKKRKAAERKKRKAAERKNAKRSTDQDEAEAAAAAVQAYEQSEAEKRKAADRKAQTPEKRKKAAKKRKREAELPTLDGTITVDVLRAQKATNAAAKALGVRGSILPLKLDGLYGPKTRKGWIMVAAKLKRDPALIRVSLKRVALVPETLEAMERAGTTKRDPKPAPRKVEIVTTPVLDEPTGEPQKAPNPPPYGYDPEAARREARALSNHLRRSGRANYDRRWLERWQRYAGVTPDRIYGGESRGALLHYGGTDAPEPFFPPLATIPYVPPELRT